jgi:hypothetical protein
MWQMFSIWLMEAGRRLKDVKTPIHQRGGDKTSMVILLDFTPLIM